MGPSNSKPQKSFLLPKRCRPKTYPVRDHVTPYRSSTQPSNRSHSPGRHSQPPPPSKYATSNRTMNRNLPPRIPPPLSQSSLIHETQYANILTGALISVPQPDEYIYDCYTVDHLPLAFHSWLRRLWRRYCRPALVHGNDSERRTWNGRSNASRWQNTGVNSVPRVLEWVIADPTPRSNIPNPRSTYNRKTSKTRRPKPLNLDSDLQVLIQPHLPIPDAGILMLAFADSVGLFHGFIVEDYIRNRGGDRVGNNCTDGFVVGDLDWISELVCRWGGRRRGKVGSGGWDGEEDLDVDNGVGSARGIVVEEGGGGSGGMVMDAWGSGRVRNGGRDRGGWMGRGNSAGHETEGVQRVDKEEFDDTWSHHAVVERSRCQLGSEGAFDAGVNGATWPLGNRASSAYAETNPNPEKVDLVRKDHVGGRRRRMEVAGVKMTRWNCEKMGRTSAAVESSRRRRENRRLVRSGDQGVGVPGDVYGFEVVDADVDCPPSDRGRKRVTYLNSRRRWGE